MNKIKFFSFLLFFLLLFTGTACKSSKECFSKSSSEQEKPNPKVTKENNALHKKALKRHLKQQTPETRKRIKQNLKQQQKNYKAGRAF